MATNAKRVGCAVAGLFLILAGIGGCMAVVVSAIEHERSPEVYQAWSKVHPEAKLTYEEWRRLYNSELLPGQSRKPDPVVVPIYTR